MGDSGSESIGGIIGFRNCFEIEILTHHFLHLFFVGAAIAGDGELNFVRSVFKNREIMLLRNQDTNAASLSNRNAGGDVFAEKEFFDADTVGLIELDDFMKRIVYIEETVWERCVMRGGDDATVEHFWSFAAASRNYTETTDTGAGVDAENFIR